MQGSDEPGDHDPAAIGIRRAALVVAACALATAAGASAQGRGQIVALPSPFTEVRPSPPLRSSASVFETRFRGRLTSTQSVRVSVDRSGTPFRIVDVDRIEIPRMGDYSFVVAAPVEDVRAVTGSGSQPGLRADAVVWQGFSPGQRVVAASIELRTRAATPALPLRVEIKGSVVRLVNRTSASATTVDANVPAASLAAVLDAARTALRMGAATPAPVVGATGAVREVRLVARLPLHVRGTVRYASGPPRQVASALGANPLRISGRGDVKELALSVSVPEPASILRPAAARRWLDLARSGRLAGGRRSTRLAVNRLLAAALARQYREFLPNPDLNGVTRTSYRYELARRTHPPAASDSGDGRSWLLSLAVVVGLLAAATAALVLWAHS